MLLVVNPLKIASCLCSWSMSPCLRIPLGETRNCQKHQKTSVKSSKTITIHDRLWIPSTHAVQRQRETPKTQLHESLPLSALKSKLAPVDSQFSQDSHHSSNKYMLLENATVDTCFSFGSYMILRRSWRASLDLYVRIGSHVFSHLWISWTSSGLL